MRGIAKRKEKDAGIKPCENTEKKKGIVKIMVKESGCNQLWLREDIGRGGKTKEEPYHIAYAMRVADRMIGILSGIEVSPDQML